MRWQSQRVLLADPNLTRCASVTRVHRQQYFPVDFLTFRLLFPEGREMSGGVSNPYNLNRVDRRGSRVFTRGGIEVGGNSL